MKETSNIVTFTKFTNNKGSASKRYWLEDAELKKEAAAQIYSGTAERVTMPFSAFPKALASATNKQAFGYGVHPLSYPDKISIVTKDSLSKARTGQAIARTKEFFKYSGAGIVMFDHDPNPYGAAINPDELIAALVAIDPGILAAAKVIRGSVSAGVHLDGEAPKTGKGFHLYIPVQDAANLEEYGKIITQRLWLAGHGFIALSSNGSMRQCSNIDANVFSPERLDFVGTPIISGTGLQYTPVDVVYQDGAMLDTTALQPLTETELAELASIVAAAKNAVKPDSVKKANEWKAERIAKNVEAGQSPEQATKTVERVLSSDGKDLYPDFILEFTSGIATVGDVLGNHKLYDGKALADPIEGSAYGKTTAKFYWNDGKPVINSMAHGGDRYFLHGNPVEFDLTDHQSAKATEDWELALKRHVQKFNETHASVIVGGSHRIMRSEPASASHNGRRFFAFYKRSELSLLYDNTAIKVGVTKKDDDIYQNHLIAWAKHFDSRSFTGGVVFLPGKEAPSNYYNTWSGFRVKAVQDDALLGNIHFHMKEVICAGHDDLYTYLLNWIAYGIQCPDKPAGTAIVTRGEKGSGKGTLGHFLHTLWGNHSLHITNAKHLVGNFNGHFNDVCFMFADEAFFSGDKQHEGVLKGLITEPSLIVERKGIDAVSQPNYLKIFMATNSDFAVPASKDERRYCVLDTASTYIGDRDYFSALHNDCSNPAVQAAFLYQMQTRDLTGWHSGDIPDSIGLREQRYHSMDSVQKWLVDALINETFGIEAHGDYWQTELNSNELFAQYIAWCDTAKSGEYRRLAQCQMSKYLGSVFQKKIHVNGTRGARGFVLGTHEEAISQFERYEKVSLSELVIK